VQLVSVPQGRLRFPAECACCLLPTDATVRVARHKSRSALVVHWEVSSSVEVPCCPDCRRHALWYEEGGWLGVLGRAVAFFGIAGVLGLFAVFVILSFVTRPVDLRHVAVGGSVLGLLAASLSVRSRLRLRPAGPVDGRHSRKGPPVDLEDFSPSHWVLRIHNDIFAQHTVNNCEGATAQLLRGRSGLSREQLGQLVGLLAILLVAAVLYFTSN
jgi:hypothetical protein